MNLRDILLESVRPADPTKFSSTERNTIAINAITKEFGLEKLSAREIRKHKADIFTVIEEVIDEILPIQLETLLGVFAEIKTIGRGDQKIFKIPTTYASKRRALGAIKNGARGGIYESRRLDGGWMSVDTGVETVGYQITLEELLSGHRTIAEMVQLITAGFSERIYLNVIAALRSIKAQIPAANKVAVSAFDQASVKPLIRIAAAYGTPVIMGFGSMLDSFNNVQGSIWPESDLEDIKRTGRVGQWAGYTMVELPNYLTDATNATWLFDENDLFILPVTEKPVKVILEGEAYSKEIVQAHGGEELHFHKLLGVGLMMVNNVCIYTANDLTVGQN